MTFAAVFKDIENIRFDFKSGVLSVFDYLYAICNFCVLLMILLWSNAYFVQWIYAVLISYSITFLLFFILICLRHIFM